MKKVGTLKVDMAFCTDGGCCMQITLRESDKSPLTAEVVAATLAAFAKEIDAGTVPLAELLAQSAKAPSSETAH